MPRKPSRSERAHANFFVATIERERARKISQAEMDRIIRDMCSNDERVRARAVREVCPCRISWEVFSRLRRDAKLLQHDPSPIVRANAHHIEKDVHRVLAYEAQVEEMADEGDLKRSLRRIRKGRR